MEASALPIVRVDEIVYLDSLNATFQLTPPEHNDDGYRVVQCDFKFNLDDTRIFTTPIAPAHSRGIYQMKLDFLFPEENDLHAVESIHLYRNQSCVAAFSEELLSSMQLDPTTGSIPLFSEMMPLVLGPHIRFHHWELIIGARVSLQRPTPIIFRIGIIPCEIHLPSPPPVPLNVLHPVWMTSGSGGGFPCFPRGWAFKFPLEDIAHGIAKIIFRREYTDNDDEEEQDHRQLEINGQVLRRECPDFPYPLKEGSGFLFLLNNPLASSCIPPLAPISSFLDFMEPEQCADVIVTYFRHGDQGPTQLDYDCVYYLDTRIFNLIITQ